MPRYPDWGDRELYNVVCVDDETTAEYVADQQADEAELDDWLASWSDDFHSDEWLAATEVSN